ncbi:MAG TPA: ABC transporter ATP-binding protein [Candidatus Dormibacteraeota bacterium]|nr:ABC transporter ATP-binding protein [Candidatus Dormibacteraeota bacterium]
MSDAVIRVEGIGKRYRVGQRESYRALRDVLSNAFRSNGKRASKDFIWAVRDVSFEVKQGEVVGLIGRNGAGKSTLLKLLARITRPTVGHAELHGRIASLLEVGTGFHPELTGRENIFLSGAILGMSKAEIVGKFDEIVAFSEVERFIDTPLKHYSSGMGMRLAFAVAAHLEPEILLVDEVLSVGDASFQKKCLGKMQEVSRGGRTIIFVSHNMTALKRLCTRAVWLDGGQLVENGDVGEVVRCYLQKNTVANLESVWPDERAAPGDHRVRLRSVRLIPQDDSSDHITVHTPLRMEFTYWNYVPGAVLNVSMFLNNLEEVCVFNLASDFEPRPAGLIRHTLEIPGDFLNAGSYYVNMLVVKDASTAILFQNNVLAFEVAEGEVVGSWYGKLPGAVRPKLKWKSEAIEAADFAVSTSRNQTV